MIKIGSLLNGRYQIQSKLGEGGFAFIYQARDIDLERDVAIKVLKPIALGTDFDRQRLDLPQVQWHRRILHINCFTVSSLYV